MDLSFVVVPPSSHAPVSANLRASSSYAPATVESPGSAPKTLGLAAVAVGVLCARSVVRPARKSKVVACRAAAADFDLPNMKPDVKLVAGFDALDIPGCKTVHFVRHSEAEVNAAGRKFPKDSPEKSQVRTSIEYFDSPLSEKGLTDAFLMQLQWRPQIEKVACSPLTRAVQTSAAMFGCDQPEGPKLMAVTGLREYCGVRYQPCDNRRTPEFLGAAFPFADFSNVPSTEDNLLGPDSIESEESVDTRIRWLFAWLKEQPENTIACVAHYQILRRIWNKHLVEAGLDSSEYGDWTNLEIRSVAVAFE